MLLSIPTLFASSTASTAAATEFVAEGDSVTGALLELAMTGALVGLAVGGPLTRDSVERAEGDPVTRASLGLAEEGRGAGTVVGGGLLVIGLAVVASLDLAVGDVVRTGALLGLALPVLAWQ